MSNYYGFSAERRSVIKNVKSVSLKSEYDAICGNREDFGVLLPNMQKGQYKRYQRFKKAKTGVGVRMKSVSVNEQRQFQGPFLNPMVQSKMMNSQYIGGGLMERVRSRGSERSKTKF
jgi:hypothetical protein